MSPETITFWIAVWGAVLGTASFGWNIYRAVTDRGELRVQCHIGRFPVAPFAILGEERPVSSQLAYNITNVGRKPIYVSHFGGVYADGASIEVVPRAPLPKELKPGETISERAEDPVKMLLGRRVRLLAAWDTTGRAHRVSRRNLRQVVAQAQRLQDGTDQTERPAAGRLGRG